MGLPADGAEPTVVCGGYIAIKDHGEVIIYTSHGGSDPAAKRLIAGQSIEASGRAVLNLVEH